MGGANSRNHDYALFGLKVHQLTMDSRIGRLTKRMYVILGLDTTQQHAYEVDDAAGLHTKTDLHPNFRKEPEDELVKKGEWQPLPGQFSTECRSGAFVCSECLVQSSRAPCIICSVARRATITI